MTPDRWAQMVAKHAQYAEELVGAHYLEPKQVVTLLRLQQASFVRLVKKFRQRNFHGRLEGFKKSPVGGHYQACDDLLAALQRERR